MKNKDSEFMKNFPDWYPKNSPIFSHIADEIDNNLSEQYFNWLNRFPLKPVMLWKTYINESEYYINFRLWSYYKLMEDNFGKIYPKYNIKKIEIYNGNNDEKIFEKFFESDEFTYFERIDKLYADEKMDRFYCKVWFNGFKDFLKVGFPVSKGVPIKTIIPNKILNFNKIESSTDKFENLQNIIINNSEYAEIKSFSTNSYFSINLKDLILSENFEAENQNARIVLELETNGEIDYYLDKQIFNKSTLRYETVKGNFNRNNDKIFINVDSIDNLQDVKIFLKFKDINIMDYIDGSDNKNILVDAHQGKPPNCFNIIDGNDDFIREDISFYLKLINAYAQVRSIENKTYSYKPNPYIDETAQNFGMWRRDNYKDDYVNQNISNTYPPYYQYDIEQDYYTEKRYLEEYYIERDSIQNAILQDKNGKNVFRIEGIYPASHIRIDIREGHIEVYNEEFHEHYLLDPNYDSLGNHSNTIDYLISSTITINELQKNDMIKAIKINREILDSDNFELNISTLKTKDCISTSGLIKVENKILNLQYHTIDEEQNVILENIEYNNNNIILNQWFNTTNIVDSIKGVSSFINDLLLFDIERITTKNIPKSQIIDKKNIASTYTQLEYIINNNSKLIKIKDMSDDALNPSLKNEWLNFNTHGIYKTHGLLKSEFYAYLHILVDIENIADKVMKWDIDNWDQKVWAGDIYDYGTFYIDIPLHKIPTNIIIPEKKFLDQIIEKTKKIGTKGIIRNVITALQSVKFKTYLGGKLQDGKWIPNGNGWARVFKLKENIIKVSNELTHKICYYDENKEFLYCKNVHQKEVENILKVNNYLNPTDPNFSNSVAFRQTMTFEKRTAEIIPPTPENPTPTPVLPTTPVTNLMKTLFTLGNTNVVASGINHSIDTVSSGYLMPKSNSDGNTGWKCPGDAITATQYTKDYHGNNYDECAIIFRRNDNFSTSPGSDITDGAWEKGLCNNLPNRISSRIQTANKNYSRFVYARQFGFSFPLPDDYINVTGIGARYSHANRTYETGTLWFLKPANSSINIIGNNYAGESVPTMTYGNAGIDNWSTETIGANGKLWGIASANRTPTELQKTNFGFIFGYRKNKRDQNINFQPVMRAFQSVLWYETLAKCQIITANVNTNTSLATKWKEIKFNLASASSKTGTGTLKIEILNAANNTVLKTQTFTRALSLTDYQEFSIDISNISYVSIKFRITMTSNNMSDNGRLKLQNLRVFGVK